MGAGMPTSRHIPVMLEEAVQALAVQPGGRYIDCTLGGGGHALSVLEHSLPGGQLLGIDADPDAIRLARETLREYRDAVLLVNDNFANLQAICLKNDFFPVHGILFDLGLSSLQLDASDRGFSFQHDAPLDMRFSPNQKLTAADIVNTYPEAELSRLIRKYGEDIFCRQIARRIVQERPIRTTLQLARLVERAVRGRKSKIHPATRTFQALRIAVNRELENLEAALKQALELLGYEGRLVVISYHSLEDRVVKQFFQQEARDCLCPPGIPACVCGHQARLRLINRRVITPSEEEIRVNPRSRSARLRAAERILAEEAGADSDSDPLFVTTVSANGWRRPALLKKIRIAFAAVGVF